ncbi:MAG: hypothetical protein GTO29_14845 [Candidatus Latescibacteria bacterium]|nr:hypothetical protein [Candidatus Latescibacterota bacterium]NIO57428.1 hypothetical protein [Candidatus Latescibacterota bacterium]
MKRFKAYLVSALVLVVFSVGWRVPWTITSPGLTKPINMTLQDTLLFVSDHSSGIHVYNIKNPAAPEFTLHIPLSGNRGTAVRGDILYANDWESLLAIRVEGDSYEVVKVIQRGGPFCGGMPEDHDRGWGCACDRSLHAILSPNGSVGSSYATFAVIDSFLYYLEYSSIVTMDISKPDDPIDLSRRGIGWEVETLYPTEDYLFVGGTRGMYIFDRSDPKVPVEIGRIEHFRGCDPVVVSDTLAFVTLRGGNTCGESRDVLLSISIRNPEDPIVISEEPINTPYGLTINNPLLYVSKGQNGFELFDVGEPDDPASLKAWSEWPTKDFIWSEDILFVMGFKDIGIYDVSAPEEPVLLSKID